jgi:hypothetical protein
MSDELTATTAEYSRLVINAMIEVLKSAASPDLMQAQVMLTRRLALTGDVIPSRVPAPANITEIGGYLNLLESLGQKELRAQVLAAILGVAGPNPPLGWASAGPALFFAARPNDRPAGPRQAAIPVEFTVRSDFAPAIDAALKAIHDRGCALPLLSPGRGLPPVGASAAPSSGLLLYLGRTLDLMPSAALHDPDADPLALAQPDAGGPAQVVARQLDGNAPQAAAVAAAVWNAWQCDASACQQITASRRYLPLAPILNAAGWYQPAPGNPHTLSQPGNWARWTNITGLVAGVTLFGDELQLLYSQTDIVASSLRERLQWVWNGADFAAA